MMRRHPPAPVTTCLVRVATALDVAQLVRVNPALAGGRIPVDPAGSRSNIVNVAEQDSTLIGLGYGGPQRSENLGRRGYDAEIRLLQVLPAFQRRGVGALLLASLARDLAAGGFREATSWVARESVAARRFCAHYGGQVVAEREHIENNAVMIEFAYAWTELAALEHAVASRSPRIRR